MVVEPDLTAALDTEDEFSDDMEQRSSRRLTQEEAKAQQKLRQFQQMGLIDVEVGEVRWKLTAV